jgi:hypothetical protein
VPPFFQRKDASDTALSLQLFQTPTVPLVASNFDFSGVFPGYRLTPEKDRLVLFRVVAAEESRAPKSLDEVRSEVEHDVRLVRAMSAAEPVAKELCVAARRIGLAAAFDLFEDLQQKLGVKSISTPAPFARRQRLSGNKLQKALLAGEATFVPPDIPGVGASRDLVEACFEMADENWKPPEIDAPSTPRIAAATTRPAQDPPPRIRLIPLPSLGKWCVVQFKKLDRVDQEKFEKGLRDEAYATLVGERGAYLLARWFLPQNVETRCGYERVQMIEPTRGRQGIQAPVEEESHPLLEFGQN